MRAHLSLILLLAPLLVHAAEPLKLQRAPMPNPPWPAGDERGMANQIGSATWNRCAWHMTLPGAQAYELSQIRSNTMPLSPFAGPYAMKPKATAGIPMTAHVVNMGQIKQGAGPLLRRGALSRRQAHRGDRARYAVHRCGARRHAPGQGAAGRGRTARPTLCGASPHADPGRHPPRREREARRDGARPRLAL